MFDISIGTLVSNLLPRFHRGARMLAWLQSLLHPVELLYNEFLVFRAGTLYDAQITGQVEWLEHLLNKAYYDNGESRAIYITDNELEDEIYIYGTQELEGETFIYNIIEEDIEETYILNSSEGKGGVDFTVWVSSSLVFDTEFMISLITKHKLAGTSFQIKTYH